MYDELNRQYTRQERDILFLHHYGMTAEELLGQMENNDRKDIQDTGSLCNSSKDTV